MEHGKKSKIKSEKEEIKKRTLYSVRFFGGKRGIRTLGAFMGHTRFPVVRLRPAQPSFHRWDLLCTSVLTVLIYYNRAKMICQHLFSSFFNFFKKTFLKRRAVEIIVLFWQRETKSRLATYAVKNLHGS